MSIALYFLIALSAVAIAVWWPWYRLRRALARPFPAEWDTVLKRNMSIYQGLAEAQRAELQQLIKHFLHQKKFIGAGGLAMTDEIRLTIAGQACLLLLNRPHSMYGRLRYIYVYPSAYLAPHREVDDGGVASDYAEGRSGESWSDGKIILSWDDVMHGARNFEDGRNVVLHEFAHQLDQESGSANGAPLLRTASCYRSWAAVLSREYQELQQDLARDYQGLLDHYGATDPAEFFAVATEAFYEQPQQMANLHPQLFEQLKKYYAADPRDWQ